MPRHNVSTKLYGVNRDNGNDTDVQRDVHRRFNKRRKEGELELFITSVPFGKKWTAKNGDLSARPDR